MVSVEERMEIAGRIFTIVRSASRNRNAWARLQGDVLSISIPSRWPSSERERVWKELLGKSVRSIEKGRWTGKTVGRVSFADGQRLMALGREFRISFVPARRFGKRMHPGGGIEIMVDRMHPRMQERASSLVKDCLIDALMPSVLERMNRINDDHFQARVARLSIRDNVSRWGSCSRDGTISLNFRLLFMPDGILDYVIVHELAHTHFRSHGPRFWSLVERVMPDHEERRRWLRKNGWSYPNDGKEGGEHQQGTDNTLKDCLEISPGCAQSVSEEPY